MNERILYMPIHRSVIDKNSFNNMINNIFIGREVNYFFSDWKNLSSAYNLTLKNTIFNDTDYVIFKLIVYLENDNKIVNSVKLLGYLKAKDLINPYKRGGWTLKPIPVSEEGWKELLSK